MLKIQLLGQFEVKRDGKTIEIASRPAQALLAYLLLNSQARHRREKLAGLLWPESDESNARNYLRQMLWQLRRALGEEYLLADKIVIGWNCDAPYTLDVAEFASEAASDSAVGDLLRALSLYEGHLLPGFYDEWVDSERERLKLLLEERMHLLLKRLEDGGRWHEVLHWGERWLALMQAPELAYHFLMRAYAALGDPSKVSLTYKRCVADLEHELAVAPAAETRALFARLSGSPWTPPPYCPYRGLFAFREEDAPFFFGREAFTKRLVEMVRQQPLVAVCGASGSGKTSLAFAGLIPRLRAEGNLHVISFRPDEDPFQSLTLSLLPLLKSEDKPQNASQLAGALKDGTIALVDLIAELLGADRAKRRFLLVADQFEELFTLCTDADLQQRFLDSLINVVAEHRYRQNPVFTCLITLRADLLGQALAYRPFADALQDASLMLGPMTRQELGRAIQRPAEKGGARFEAGLVPRILEDVGREPGNLPLLEFALAQLWEKNSNGELTHWAYEEIGKVEGALARHADRVYSALAREEQRRARQILVQMVQPGHQTDDTRRRASRTELGESNWRLVRKLADARLVVTGSDPDGQEIVELVHEALIHGWERFRVWMEADRAFRAWQERLRSAEHQWQTSQQDEGALLRGLPLAEAEVMLMEHSRELSTVEKRFIESSLTLRAHQKTERQNLRTRILFGLAAGLVIAVVLAIISAVAWQRSFESEQAAREAYNLSLAANALQLFEVDDNAAALALALAANRTDQPSPETQFILREAAFAPGARRLFEVSELTTDDPPIAVSVALSPDGSTALASVSKNGALVLFDLNTGRMLRRFEGHTAYINELAFSPDGKQALSGADDGMVILWDVATGQPIHRLFGHSSLVLAVAFSPDGRLAVSAGPSRADTLLGAIERPGELILWDLESGRELRRFEGGHSQIILDATFSPDGRRMLSSSGLRKMTGYLPAKGNLVLWDVESGEILQTIVSIQNPTKVAISPDGKTALAGSMDKNLYLLDLYTGKILYVFDGQSDWINDVAFSPDGRLALAGLGDGSLALWNLNTKERIVDFRIHTSEAINVVMSADGATALSTSSDGTMILWDLLDSGEIQRFTEHTASISDLAFTPDGKRLLSSSADHSLRLWDLASGQPLSILRGHTDVVLGVDISPDGDSALSASADRTVRLWDLKTGRELRRFFGHAGETNDVAFLPDGKTALSTSSDGVIIQWDVASGTVMRYLLGHTLPVQVVDISPDGKLALSGGGDGLILWDLQTGAQIRPFYGRVINVSDATFGLDAAIAFSGSSTLGSSASLWDVATGDELYQLPISGPVPTVAVSRDGKLGLYSGQDGKMALLDLETGRDIHRYVGHDSNFINSLVFAPDGFTAASGADDSSIILWQVLRPSTDELFDWIIENRFVRELTCGERDLYHVEPLCPESAEYPMPGLVSTPEQNGQSEFIAPRPERLAQVGENRGEILPGDFDTWLYEGRADEVISLQLNADRPRDFTSSEDALQLGLLDTALLLIAPDGSLLASSYMASPGQLHRTNAMIENFVLPVSGSYRIEARSFGNQTGGGYTLIIISSR